MKLRLQLPSLPGRGNPPQADGEGLISDMLIFEYDCQLPSLAGRGNPPQADGEGLLSTILLLYMDEQGPASQMTLAQICNLCRLQ